MDRSSLAALIVQKLDSNKAAFPDPATMAEHRSLRENKKIAAQLNKYNPLLEEITFAFQDPRVVKVLGEINEIKDKEDKGAGGPVNLRGCHESSLYRS